MDGQPAKIDRETLIARARGLLPALYERAALADDMRRIPQDTQRALMEAGLYRIYLPARYGGFEMDQMLQVDLAAPAARRRGSTPSWRAIVGCTGCSIPGRRTRCGATILTR